MKRSAETGNNDDEPKPKVMFVEREERPLGLPLVNPVRSGKKSYVEAMEISESYSHVSTALEMNAKNKLDVLDKQMRNLQGLMADACGETRLSIELHDAACNFVKKPGHIYHLYQRPSGEKYFGMVSPEEWRTPPHQFLGSFILQADSSWVPAHLRDSRYKGLNFLKQMSNNLQLQA